ncbi:hypothetical protein RhiirC2_715250 [Rhizophagus irregularis]|uniref:Uncharacterized protein n=1 Tax=Rhizophagus irregularis TaxID=588596 RepID=A0A2N1MW98_9GLOM|nr:hypothetical protein RhiirC2_715250 [Rhizophagus irregularis]
MKKQEKQTDKRRQSSDSRSSRGPFVLSVDGEIRQTPSNRQTEQTSSITPSNRQTTSTPSNHQTEQTSSITPSNRQTEQTSSITPSNLKLPRSLQTAVQKDPELESDEEFCPNKRQKSEKKQKHKQKRGKRLTKRSYDNESSSKDESSSDENEMDEKKARAEMKTILKTVPKTLDMNYNETFTSGANVEIRRKLISCTIQKKIRRLKSAKSLYANNNSEISKYNKEELLKILKNRKYHSPEISESDDDPINQNKHIICVYDLSWRSDELKTLLRDILDPHSFTIQIAHLTREHNYDDELQSYDHPILRMLLNDVNLGSKTPVYGDNENSIVGNMPVYGDNEDSIMYNTDEEYAHSESSTTGMIHGAILEADSQQKDKNKKIESFAWILNLQVFRLDLESTGIVPSALGLGIGIIVSIIGF